MLRKSLIQEFEGTSLKYANEVAVIEGDVSINFSSLASMSKILASGFIENGVEQNSVIAFYLPKGINCVAANLAASYACSAYMNLDLKAPVHRVQAVIQNVKPSLIVTDIKNLKSCKLIASSQIKILLIEDLESRNQVNLPELSRRMSKLIDTDLYCVINTSGSTGVPKSVALGHRSFLDFCDWTFSEFDKNNFRKLGSLSPSIFDIYSFELALLCTVGSSLIVIPDALSAFPIKIIEKLVEHKVTFIFWVPTIMVNIANMDLLASNVPGNLKLCWFAGEVFPTKQFNYWRRNLPEVEYVNLYGPIEITLDCTYYKIKREIADDEQIPIGFPCDNTGLLILNDENNECGTLEEGELCVRGSSLAFGYYNNPEKTESAFVQNPLQKSYNEIIYRTGDIVHLNELGEIIYRGRRDTLIKHFGYRIELGEIEHVAISNKIVKNCCAIHNAKEKRIVLYYEPIDGIEEKQVIIKMMSFLPKYMVPTEFIMLKELTMNSNGKIDRNFYKLLSND
jgi:amino acid adenylation domain-containing protein